MDKLNSSSLSETTTLQEIRNVVAVQTRSLKEIVEKSKKSQEEQIREKKNQECDGIIYKITFVTGTIIFFAGGITAAVSPDSLTHKITGGCLIAAGTLVSAISAYVFNQLQNNNTALLNFFAAVEISWAKKSEELEKLIAQVEMLEKHEDHPRLQLESGKIDEPRLASIPIDTRFLSQFIGSYTTTFSEMRIISEDGTEFVAKKFFNQETYSNIVCIAARNLPTDHPARQKLKRLERASTLRLDHVKDYGVGPTAAIDWKGESSAHGATESSPAAPRLSDEEYSSLAAECANDIATAFDLPKDTPLDLIKATTVKKGSKDPVKPASPTSPDSVTVHIAAKTASPSLSNVSKDKAPEALPSTPATTSPPDERTILNILINSNSNNSATVTATPPPSEASLTPASAPTSTTAISAETSPTPAVKPEEITVTTA